ncbi:Beta-barrel assembly-enhancing protease [Usitatibacter rugosus]|uniref:Beta-barrel assembly-enhancing protease n=1 Tax=Usitatibacter rugosus TaxID=2732067 RepID=A0A6M4GZE8_9PROT|nr:tetratricopeptide repeat protein [Usitatibacter rugosus]QJR12640.1 Beta-barrel assembly-enhancing protease [Usitatibacter rugosus]
MSASTPEAAALALFQSGRLDAAEVAWRALLAARPDDPQALHMLGLILARTGRAAEGRALVDRSIERDRRNPAFLNNRAMLLAEAGRFVDAERDARRAVQLDPLFVAGWIQLGSVLRRQDRLEEATAAFRRASTVDPRSSEAHVGLGNVLRARGDIPGARAAYAAALALDPRNPSAHYNLGNLQMEANELAAAEGSFRATLARAPQNSLAMNNLGVILTRTGRAGEAIPVLEQGVRIAPGNPEVLTSLGLALQGEGRVADAIARYREALTARPGFAPALNNWGNALKDGGDLVGAAERFDQAIAADPRFADALNNRANVALESGDTPAAKAFYARALEARPDFPDPRFSLAQLALRDLDFARGWDAFELRFATHPPMAQWRAPALPRLTPAELKEGHRVAVWREQGVGDLLLFGTLLPELAATGTRVVLEVDARMVALFARNLPGIEVVSPEDAPAAFAKCDRHFPLGSLPGLFRRDVASFAAQPRGLFRADPARVAATREALGPGHWIAVSWHSFQGRGRRHHEIRKSMPVEALAGLAAIPGVRLLDVQYGDVAGDRAAFEAAHPGLMTRLDGLDTFNDFEGLMAALEACRGVLTISNVTAHLAGASGARGLLLYTGTFAPMNYWAARSGDTSLWYPSLGIVSGAQGWEPLVAEAARRLAL